MEAVNWLYQHIAGWNCPLPWHLGEHLLSPRAKLDLCSPLIPAQKITLGRLFQRFNSS